MTDPEAFLRSIPRSMMSPATRLLLGIADYPDEATLAVLLAKFANHRDTCRCFICRTLSDSDKASLEAFWHRQGGRK